MLSRPAIHRHFLGIGPLGLVVAEFEVPHPVDVVSELARTFEELVNRSGYDCPNIQRA